MATVSYMYRNKYIILLGLIMMMSWHGNTYHITVIVGNPMMTFIDPLCSRADSGFVPSQWETSLQSNAVSHWLGTNLELGLCSEAAWLVQWSV